MDAENLALPANKKNEMKRMCGTGTVKTIGLKNYHKCNWNTTSPHYVSKRIEVLVSDLEQN